MTLTDPQGTQDAWCARSGWARNYDPRVADVARRPFERRGGLSPDSPLVGSLREREEGFDPRTDELELPDRVAEPESQPDPRSLSTLIPAAESDRQIDDWGRSEAAFGSPSRS